jgi:hypothetical protein
MPLQKCIVFYSQRIKLLAEVDEKVSQESDIICDLLNKALDLNKHLESLYAQCPSAVNPAQLIALKTEGKLLESTQNILILMAQKKFFQLRSDFQTEFHAPKRLMRGPCDLPGPLKCLRKKIFSLQRNIKNQSGGSVGISHECQQIKWQFEDSRVKAL